MFIDNLALQRDQEHKARATSKVPFKVSFELRARRTSGEPGSMRVCCGSPAVFDGATAAL